MTTTRFYYTHSLKRFFFLIGCTTFWFGAAAQDLYDLTTIQTIRITFAQSNWDYMLDTATAGSDGYIMAQTVEINGVVFDSVGVKYKGNSTYNANQAKNPFHIELDTYKAHDYGGYTDLKLSNVAKDPSFVREVLGYQILRQYMHAPLSNYANVYVNGNLIGLYVSSESVSKKFVGKHFYSTDNTFVKCNPIGGAGPGSSAKPNLVYLGTDSASYYAAYEMKSDYGWSDLIHLADTLKNYTSSVEELVDVDRVLWMLSFDNAVVNLDSYIGGFAQNYYLYKDDNNRFNPVVWDLNEAFGTFSQTGTSNLTSTSSKQQMSHLLHLNDTQWPLVQELLAIPTYKRMYVAHLKTILAENFSNGSYSTSAQALQALIATAVNTDVNKFFTYTQFQSNLTSDVNAGMSSAPGITNLMNARATYLLSQADFTAVAPSISAVEVSNSSPLLNSTIWISATTNLATSVYVGYRSTASDRFIKITMYDDGNHNDGAAGDFVFGASIPVEAATIQYYVYAENNNAGIFYPQRAEHEFFSIQAVIPQISSGQVVINEFMAVNTETQVDPNGDFEDWIELHNNTTQPFSLKGLYLSDNAVNPLQWKFPDYATIPANGYVIVWADNDTTQSGFHANFKLSANGESIVLSYVDGTVLDSITFIDQLADISMQRCPNGTGEFEMNTPTFNYFNCIAGIDEQNTMHSCFLFPNPSEGKFQIASVDPIENVQIRNVNGQLIAEIAGLHEKIVSVEMPTNVPGLYLVQVNGNVLKYILK